MMTKLQLDLRTIRQDKLTCLLEVNNRPDILCEIISEGSRYVPSAWVHDLETDEDVTVMWNDIVGVSEV
jgi:hypothetical protein